MPIPEKPEDLTNLFRKLGAPHPDKWASSQLNEGIPQLHRYLWLRQAWKSVVCGYQWIEKEIERARAKPNAPYSGIGQALGRCIEKGIDRADLNEIVRGKQVQLLFALCYLLEDPNFAEPELREVGWGLFQTDENGNPQQRITGLHESVLATDPTLREARPNSRT